MKIKMKVSGSCVRGVFKPGDVVDWPDYDAQPMVDGGLAEHVRAPKTPHMVPRKAKSDG